MVLCKVKIIRSADDPLKHADPNSHFLQVQPIKKNQDPRRAKKVLIRPVLDLHPCVNVILSHNILYNVKKRQKPRNMN